MIKYRAYYLVQPPYAYNITVERDDAAAVKLMRLLVIIAGVALVLCCICPVVTWALLVKPGL